MAQSVVGDVAVRVGADVGPLKIGLRDGARAVGRFDKSTKTAASRIARNAKVAAAALVAMGTAAVAASRRAIKAVDGIAKSADKIGLTTDSLQELRFAADSASIPIATLDMAMQRFTRRVAEARQGTGEAKAALEEMGIVLSDAAGNALSIDDVLGQVADAMVATADQSDRVRLAMKLFDSEGVALVNMLKDGKAGLDEMRDAARRMGAVIGEETVRKAEALNTTLGQLSTTTSAELRAALVEIGPVLVVIAQSIAGMAMAAGDAVGTIKSAASAVREFLTLQNEFDLSKVSIPPSLDNTLARPDPNAADFQEATAAIEDHLRATGQLNTAFVPENNPRLSIPVPPAIAPAAPEDPATGVPRTGGGGGSGPLAAMIPTQADFEALRQGHATAREIAQAEHERELEQIRALREAGVATREEINALEARVEEDHQRRLTQIRLSGERERLRAISGAFGDVASLMSTGNKRLFKIGQAASIAQAVVDGYEAAVAAWKKGMQIGGPGLAAAFTAASLVKTGALIAKIKSATPGGGGGQGNVGGGAGTGAGGAANTGAAGGAATSRLITVQLLGEGEFVRRADLITAINELVEDGGQVRFI